MYLIQYSILSNITCKVNSWTIKYLTFQLSVLDSTIENIHAVNIVFYKPNSVNGETYA